MADYDNMYEENDFDEDIQLREELIEEAQQLQVEEDLSQTLRAANDLRRRWKKIAFWDSAYEETLREKFDAILDVFYRQQNEVYKANEIMKQELIEEAKQLKGASNFKDATASANTLMQRWKEIGSAGRDNDERLWTAFNEARNVFFAKKEEHWENLQDQFKNAKQVKEEIITKAKAVSNSDEWQKTGAVFRELMEQWKAVGSAGREVEDTLWEAFNEQRQAFYTRRDAYYETQREQHDKNFDAKKVLLEKAQAIQEEAYYSRENTQALKELAQQWKAIGSCGKTRENDLWDSFRKVNDAYFAGLKQYNEQKQEQWRQSIIDARTRKLDLIQKQKRQIKHMQDEIVGLLGERAINDMEEAIKEKEEFILELEEQVKELDAKLVE